MVSNSDDLFLVDGSGFIFRAYHALPPLTRRDGTPVGAVMGFCNMLLKLLLDHPHAKIAVVFDTSRQTFRNEIYPAYKANRPPPPEDLIPQFALIREATKAYGLPSLELDGFEADDLIATYARLGVESGIGVTIVSSDKDLMQLVRDGVRLMDPIKQTIIGPAEVMEKFGVLPDKVIDVQSLAGDSIDNVPGVPGIGVKTAAQLITEYGSLEELLNRTADIKQPKRRESLEQNAEAARMSKKLVTLSDQVPVPQAIETLVPEHPFSQRLVDFLEAQGFKSLAARMAQKSLTTPPAPIASSSAATPEVFPPLQTDYTLMTSPALLKDWIKDAEETGLLAIDTETTGLTPARAKLVGISLATRAGRACYIPVGHDGGGDLLGLSQDSLAQPSISEILDVLQPLLRDPSLLKVGHNIKFDLQMLMPYGVQICPLDDTMLMSYVLDGTSHGHGLDELALTLCGHKMISYDEVTGTGKGRISFATVPLDKACDYAAEDADFTLRLYHHLKPRLAPEKMTAVYEDIERPLADIIAHMEFAGIKVDPLVLRSLSQTFGVKIVTLEDEIHKLAGHTFNVGSPKQLGTVLFDEMGLSGGTKTKTGEWSTSADVLEDLAVQGHGFVEKILEWRHLSKLKSTYTEALQEAINPATGRVHTSFSMALTNTGRLSSSDPNLQNIPIRTEEGRLIRTAFVAEEGHLLISADYSQIELRLVAEMAGIEVLKQAFRSGEDIHALTASQVFGIPLDQMTPDIRRKAKAINFGIIYGISGFGLAKQLDCSPSEASAYIKQYLGRFPELSAFMDRTKAEARDNGFVRTLYGRKCMIAGIHDKNAARRNFAERQAINAPLQGTAADLIKMAMIRVNKMIEEENLPVRLLLQVHDELVLEGPENEAERLAKMIKAAMESVARFSIPLVADAKCGKNWSQAH
ncbi:MAG: DNA polymerase I [Alphaproteobacteria bacterium]|nr:DNA polymerase I [Alphaproteobacteria bacterium]